MGEAMDLVPNLKKALKTAQPVIKQYVAELEKRNAKLHAQIVKLQADNMECHNRVKALEKNVKANAPKIHIHLADET
jgi:cell division protein FtsB